MHTMIIANETTMLQTAVTSDNNHSDDGKLTWNSSSQSLHEEKVHEDENDLTTFMMVQAKACSPSTSSSLSDSDSDDDDDDSITSSSDDSAIICLDEMQGPISRPRSTSRSILKSRTKSEPRYIKQHRRSWISLPSPDMQRILEELAQQSESSCSEETETLSLPDALTTTLSLTSSESNSNKSSQKRSVSFDSVKIRSYQQTMGDNPAVSYGPPISLDWDFEEHDCVDLDAYESARGLNRRGMRQMALSYYQRKSFLAREYGFTEEDLLRAKKDVNKTKFRRGVTNTLLPWMRVEVALESAGRKAKRMFKSKE